MAAAGIHLLNDRGQSAVLNPLWLKNREAQSSRSKQGKARPVKAGPAVIFNQA